MRVGDSWPLERTLITKYLKTRYSLHSFEPFPGVFLANGRREPGQSCLLVRTRRSKWSRRSLSAGCARARARAILHPRSCRYLKRECRSISPLLPVAFVN